MSPHLRINGTVIVLFKSNFNGYYNLMKLQNYFKPKLTCKYLYFSLVIPMEWNLNY